MTNFGCRCALVVIIGAGVVVVVGGAGGSGLGAGVITVEAGCSGAGGGGRSGCIGVWLHLCKAMTQRLYTDGIIILGMKGQKGRRIKR